MNEPRYGGSSFSDFIGNSVRQLSAMNKVGSKLEQLPLSNKFGPSTFYMFADHGERRVRLSLRLTDGPIYEPDLQGLAIYLLTELSDKSCTPQFAGTSGPELDPLIDTHIPYGVWHFSAFGPELSLLTRIQVQGIHFFLRIVPIVSDRVKVVDDPTGHRAEPVDMLQMELHYDEENKQDVPEQSKGQG